MSKRSKGVSKQRVISLFEEMDLDEEISTFEELKEILTKKIIEKEEQFDRQASYYQSVKEKLNGKE